MLDEKIKILERNYKAAKLAEMKIDAEYFMIKLNALRELKNSYIEKKGD